MPGSAAPGPPRPLAYYADIAHVATVYDYLLGGKDHFLVDAEAAEQAMRINPDLVSTVRANRAFLGRATSYLAREAGIRQFLDIGAGLPAIGNVHEIAQAIAPESRVVYVDHDPVVLTHARALLISVPPGRTDYVKADLREPRAIVAEAARTLDFDQPVAVLLLAVLPSSERMRTPTTWSARSPPRWCPVATWSSATAPATPRWSSWPAG